MNKLVLLLSMTTICFLFSCSEKKTETQDKTVLTNDLTANQLTALNDSCTKAWVMMLDSDNQKIKDIERLLQEISYIPNHNDNEVKRLSMKAKELTTLRYTEESVSTEQIDAYDKATDDLLKSVFELKRTTKGVEQYTLTEELDQSIREADGKVINYRVLYDAWAQKYNEALQKSKNTEFKKKITFQII